MYAALLHSVLRRFITTISSLFARVFTYQIIRIFGRLSSTINIRYLVNDGAFYTGNRASFRRRRISNEKNGPEIITYHRHTFPAHPFPIFFSSVLAIALVRLFVVCHRLILLTRRKRHQTSLYPVFPRFCATSRRTRVYVRVRTVVFFFFKKKFFSLTYEREGEGPRIIFHFAPRYAATTHSY